MRNRVISVGALLAGALAANTSQAVVINGFTFDLSQFDNAAVTYRADAGSTVDFDGKLWDNANGVNNRTLGELAAGQYGTDPGDQVTLQNRTVPDWLKLTYGTPIQITADAHEMVIYEITSSTSGVDAEGTSFQVAFNGGSLIAAASATSVSYYAKSGSEENTNQIVFDLYNFGFGNGDLFETLYIENVDSGSGTSDPDFIFAGMAGTLTPTVPEPATLSLLALGLAGIGAARKRARRI